MIFPERLKELRQKKGLTQQEIADLVHVNRVTYTNWEEGTDLNFEASFDQHGQEGIKEISIKPNAPIPKYGNNSETTETK